FIQRSPATSACMRGCSPWRTNRGIGDRGAMSGHSKWAQIKRKKAATDEKRGRMFGKLLRAVEVATREGGPSIEGNMTLASAVEDELLEVVLEAGADDLRDAGEQWEVIAVPEGFGSVRKALDAAGVKVTSAELTRLPQTGVPLDGERAQSVLRLVEALEELDD